MRQTRTRSEGEADLKAPASHRRRRNVGGGWTAARQLTFLEALARTRSVTRAARAAGMSRESAYRLRKRDPNGLFAAAWDRAIQGPVLSSSKGHRFVNVAQWRQRRENRLFSPEGHEVKEVHDPRFSLAAQSTA